VLYQIELRPFDTGPSPAWRGTSGQLSIGFAARLRQSSGAAAPPPRSPARLRFAVVDARRPKALELGLFLVVVALPMAFTPFTVGPFADPKIVVLGLGALLIWLGGVPIDHRLARIAAAWVGVTVAAAAAGVDPSAGLVATASGEGGGLYLTICCAVLLVCGAGLPRELVARVRRWLVWTGVAVSALLLVYRLVPEVFAELLPRVNFIGATLGNQLFAGAFVAVAMAAAATGDDPVWRRLALLAVMTAAVSSTGERSSLLLPIVALAVAWWRARQGWRRTAAAAAVVIGTFAAWMLAEPLLPGEPPPESAIQQLGGSATDSGRFVVWRVSARAWLDRPVLGWGPGVTRSVYLHTGSPEEVDSAGRGWTDAHDLFLETGVTTGILGVLPLLALLAIAVARALRSPPEEAWAVGAAASLGAYSLVEPLNLILTPLLFLCAGILCAGILAARRPMPRPAGRPAGSGARASRALVTATLGLVVAVGALAFGASTFERQGSDYGDPGALRTSLRLQPWRLSARQELAIQLAAAARGGDEAAAAEAGPTIAAGVRARPWDPDVRIFAARVATLLNDPEAAETWLREQLERFPGDRSWVSRTVNAPAVTGA
jgi:O-antigen ligase